MRGRRRPVHNGAMDRDCPSLPRRRPIHHRALAVLLAGLACLLPGAWISPAAAQAAPSAAQADDPAHYDTGDAWLDARLADIDRYASQYPETFAAEVERYAGMPRGYVQGLAAQPGWRPGDAWYACFLARSLETDCRSVVRARARLGAAGNWREATAQLRGEDGPDVDVPLRLALADSYRRWDRALEPDAALRGALRQRERARQQENRRDAEAPAR